MKRPRARISSSSRVSPVSSRRSTRPAVRSAVATDRRRGAVGERGPPVVVDEAVAGPLDAAVGALQRAVDARRRRLVQAHHAAGVAHQVVGLAGDLAVGRPVVLVQPRAVRLLVVARTTATAASATSRATRAVGCRAALGRGERAERDDGGDDEPGRRERTRRRGAAHRGHPPPDTGHEQRRQREPRRQWQAAGDEAAGAGDRRYRRGRRRSAAIAGGAASMRNRASQSSRGPSTGDAPVGRVRRVDRQGAVTCRRHGPDHERGEGEVREHLDVGGELDGDVEADGDPDRRRSACGATTGRRR